MLDVLTSVVFSHFHIVSMLLSVLKINLAPFLQEEALNGNVRRNYILIKFYRYFHIFPYELKVNRNSHRSSTYTKQLHLNQQLHTGRCFSKFNSFRDKLNSRIQLNCIIDKSRLVCCTHLDVRGFSTELIVIRCIDV